MSDSIDTLILELTETTVPKVLNRFRTMLCLINSLDLDPGEYKQTRYWTELDQAQRSLVAMSRERKETYQSIKQKLKIALERPRKRRKQPGGINVMRILMSYSNALRTAEDPTTVRIDKLPVARVKRKGGQHKIQLANAYKQLEELNPHIRRLQKGEVTYHNRLYLNNTRTNQALRAYSRIIYGVKKLSQLEQDALALLPNKHNRGRPTKAFLEKLYNVTDEKKRKRMIYDELLRNYKR